VPGPMTFNALPSLGTSAGIGVGRPAFGFRPPSLRTGRADFPHPALRLVGSLQRLTRCCPGCGHREQPELREVDVGPANVGPPPPGASLSVATAQNASQPHSHPSIQRRERPSVSVFEVLKPTSQYGVEAVDDGLEAVAVVPLREAADVVLELREAFLSRPLLACFEVVAEEVETSGLAHVDQSGLLRTERQAAPGQLVS